METTGSPGDPTVSVIMPLGGGAARYVREAIASVEQQTFPDWELIVQPDAGMESAADDIAGLDIDGLRVLEPEDTNEPAARNRCLDVAQGEYIAVLDADDRATRHRLAYQVGTLDSRPHLDLLGQSRLSVRSITPDGDVISEHSEEMMPMRSVDDGNAIHHSSVMFRNEGWRYREKFAQCCDYDLYLRVADGGFGNIGVTTEDLVTVRETPDSMSRQQPAENAGYGVVAAVLRMRRQQGLDERYDAWDPADNAEIVASLRGR